MYTLKKAFVHILYTLGFMCTMIYVQMPFFIVYLDVFITFTYCRSFVTQYNNEEGLISPMQWMESQSFMSRITGKVFIMRSRL